MTMLRAGIRTILPSSFGVLPLRSGTVRFYRVAVQHRLLSRFRSPAPV